MALLKIGGINGNLPEVPNLREVFEPLGELFSADLEKDI